MPDMVDGYMREIREIHADRIRMREDQEKIFEKFTQLRNHNAQKIEGTGLGLVLTKSLVELHGGKVRVESGGEGKGSTFSFTLPVKQKGNKEAQA